MREFEQEEKEAAQASKDMKRSEDVKRKQPEHFSNLRKISENMNIIMQNDDSMRKLQTKIIGQQNEIIEQQSKKIEELQSQLSLERKMRTLTLLKQSE